MGSQNKHRFRFNILYFLCHSALRRVSITSTNSMVFDDLKKVFIISKLPEGCHRSRISLDNRAPITISVLSKICRVLQRVCYDSFEVNRHYLVWHILDFFVRVSLLPPVSIIQAIHCKKMTSPLQRTELTQLSDSVILKQTKEGTQFS